MKIFSPFRAMNTAVSGEIGSGRAPVRPWPFTMRSPTATTELARCFEVPRLAEHSFHLTYADLPGLSSEAVVATLTEYACNLLKIQGYMCIEFYA
jgi:hypothetical protein